ncbi:MAG: purine-nucleoside phosphorylase, partial [Planctomycetales bacterium]|nr:purine-nucleoside phosphorylase [Planctomycetales bacterium]
PAAAVAGHGSTVRSIANGDQRVLAFMGRVHCYEGHHPNVVAHAVRTAVAAGCRTVVLTNAAGGLREGMRPGQPVLIRDHVNLTGRTPLLGPNDDRLGPRFPDMSDAYSARLRALAHEIDPTLEEAVYAGFLGPTYETPAEVRMAATLGGELVGMSTVLESIAAVHAGAELLAISLVTNLAAGLSDEVLAHDDVLAVATRSA